MHLLVDVSFSTIARVERCVRCLKERYSPRLDFDWTQGLPGEGWDVEVLFPSHDFDDAYAYDPDPIEEAIIKEAKAFAEGFWQGIEKAE